MNLVLVSPIFYYKINTLFDEAMVPIDNSFIKTHMNILAFKRSYFTVMPYRSGNKQAIRMDRNIMSEVLSSIVGKSVVFSYNYEVVNKKGIKYHAQYKFDCVSKGPRNIWIYKEEMINQGDSKLSLVQPIMPVCVGDDIKFAINFYNLHGMVDLHSIEWKTPYIEDTPSIPKEIESNFLEGIDRNRICEVEELNSDWILYKYFDKKNKIEYDNFNPQLVLKETKCSGIDVICMRSRYEVAQMGDVQKARQRLGVNIAVYHPEEDVVAEVKRLGLFYDLENFLQLRVGDKLTFYLSRYE